MATTLSLICIEPAHPLDTIHQIRQSYFINGAFLYSQRGLARGSQTNIEMRGNSMKKSILCLTTLLVAGQAWGMEREKALERIEKLHSRWGTNLEDAKEVSLRIYKQTEKVFKVKVKKEKTFEITAEEDRNDSLKIKYTLTTPNEFRPAVSTVKMNYPKNTNDSIERVLWSFYQMERVIRAGIFRGPRIFRETKHNVPYSDIVIKTTKK